MIRRINSLIIGSEGCWIAWGSLCGDQSHLSWYDFSSLILKLIYLFGWSDGAWDGEGNGGVVVGCVVMFSGFSSCWWSEDAWDAFGLISVVVVDVWQMKDAMMLCVLLEQKDPSECSFLMIKFRESTTNWKGCSTATRLHSSAAVLITPALLSTLVLLSLTLPTAQLLSSFPSTELQCTIPSTLCGLSSPSISAAERWTWSLASQQ